MTEILVVTTPHRCNPQLAIAAARAGQTGILDLGYTHDRHAQFRAVQTLAAQSKSPTRWGLRWDMLWDARRAPSVLANLLGGREAPILVLAHLPDDAESRAGVLAESRRFAERVLLEASHWEEAAAAAAMGFDGVVLRGAEAGGLCGSLSSFALLEERPADFSLPFWIQGGVGPDIAPAVLLAGAAGVVLVEQVWLAAESPCDEAEANLWSHPDGIDEIQLGDGSIRLRCLTRSDDSLVDSWREARAAGVDFRSWCRDRLLEGRAEGKHPTLIPIGDDIAFARRWADEDVTVAGILDLFRRRIDGNLKAAQAGWRSANHGSGSPLGLPHRLWWATRRPSESAAATPVVCFGPSFDAETIRKASETFGEAPWVVACESLAGDVGAAIRNTPPTAVIAPGFIDAGAPVFQSASHAEQLASGLKAGGRRFVFLATGEESMFLEWQEAIDVVEDATVDEPREVEIVLGGPVSTPLAAAMIAAASGGLCERGYRVGIAAGPGWSGSTDDVGWSVENAAAASRLLEQAVAARRTWHAEVAPAPKSDDIAIIGMACMFPKAADLRQFWENIVNKVDAIEEVPADRWRTEDFFDPDRFAPDKVYSKWGGFLGEVVFDPVKWRIPPASLKSIEPIQLLSLEIAVRAMADAGYDRREFPRERTGVLFATAGSHDLGSGYAFRTMLRHYLPKIEALDASAKAAVLEEISAKLPEWTEDSFPGFLLNVVAGRIARELNVNGPNYVVDAACAASLAALHAAIEQLRTRTSDMMLVGAADATNNPFCYMSFSKTHALSPRGRSRPFDDSADGIALGEGIAVVVLKRLEDAERDGDKIYAVIKGIGSSSDGKNKSLTAPHPPGQIKAVVRAYTDAQVSPATVTLVEAHGTGTAVGDSAEITTLTRVFETESTEPQFAAVGSVKSMIGHTKTVAGIASLIKTALACKHGVLPPTIGVETPTKKVDFAKSPFYINTEARPWIEERGSHPRRAGVSAFGFGGTNFHVVLEEYTGSYHEGFDVDLTPRPVEVFLWSRPAREELRAALEAFSTRISELDNLRLADLAHAVHLDECRRTAHAERCRLGIVAGSLPELRQRVERAVKLLAERSTFTDPAGIFASDAAPVAPEQICFMYPGQGSQTVGMLGDLVLASKWGQELFARANRLLADYLPKPLSRYIYPPPAFSEAERKWQFTALSDTRVAQPALGVVELFATELLARFGIRPGMLAGHSYGEHVALHVAGCLTQDELLCLSATRGRVCAEAAQHCPGGMAAVRADADATRMALKDLNLPAELANLNAPDQTIIAGPDEVIDAAVEQLTQNGIRATRIPVSAPFHTPLLKAGSDEMAVHFAKASFTPPSLPVYSNTTGERHSGDSDAIRDLLARHFSEPVYFEKEVRRIYLDGARLFLEVGPGKVLTSLVSRILKDEPITAISLDAPGREGWTQFGHLLAQSHALGLPVELDPWFHGRGLPMLTCEELFDRARKEAKPKPSDWIIGPSRAEPVTPLPVRKSTAGGLRAKFGKGAEGAPQPAATDPRAPSQPAIAAAAAAERPAFDASPLERPGGEPPIGAADCVQPEPIGETEVSPVPPSPAFVAVGAEAGASHPRPAPRSSTLAQAVSARSRRPVPSLSQSHRGASMATIPSGSNPTTSGEPPAASSAGAELFLEFQATTRMMLELQHSQQQLMERFLETQERMLHNCLQAGAGQRLVLPAARPAPQIAPAVPAYAVPPATPVVRPPVVASPVVHSPQKVTAPKPAAAAPVATPATAPAPAAVAAPTGSPAKPAAAVAPPATAVSSLKPAAEAIPAVNGDGPPPTEMFTRDLLRIVSERTGYPEDMLDVELPLEAGLGIDSIKTVEIFSNLKDYHPYFNEEGKDEEEMLAEFTKLKTLKDIIDSYERRRSALAGQGSSSKAPATAAHAANGNGGVERYALSAAEAPLEENGVRRNFLSATSS